MGTGGKSLGLGAECKGPTYSAPLLRSMTKDTVAIDGSEATAQRRVDRAVRLVGSVRVDGRTRGRTYLFVSKIQCGPVLHARRSLTSRMRQDEGGIASVPAFSWKTAHPVVI